MAVPRLVADNFVFEWRRNGIYANEIPVAELESTVESDLREVAPRWEGCFWASKANT